MTRHAIKQHDLVDAPRESRQETECREVGKTEGAGGGQV